MQRLDQQTDPTPVAPLGIYDAPSRVQAVPAISRCTQGITDEFLQKGPPIIDPASRPANILISAKSLLICLLYSSNRGNCQTRSTASSSSAQAFHHGVIGPHHAGGVAA